MQGRKQSSLSSMAVCFQQSGALQQAFSSGMQESWCSAREIPVVSTGPAMPCPRVGWRSLSVENRKIRHPSGNVQKPNCWAQGSFNQKHQEVWNLVFDVSRGGETGIQSPESTVWGVLPALFHSQGLQNVPRRRELNPKSSSPLLTFEPMALHYRKIC